MMLRNVFANTWGPQPRITRWAYTGIVRPSLTYGSVIWARVAKSPDVSKKLRQLQRLALVQISHVRRSTPTAALELIYNLPPLDLFVWECALKTIARVKLSQGLVQTCPGGHQGQLWADLQDCLLKGNPPESSHLDDCFKTLDWEQNYKVIIGGGEDLLCKRDWTAYTDGSKSDDKSGSGAVILRDGHEFCHISYALSTCSVFQSEISAISTTCRALLSNGVNGEDIDLLVDSKASLLALNNPMTHSHSVRKCKELLNSLGSCNGLSLHWIRAHQKKWNYNHLADKLANQGAESGKVRDLPLLCKRALFANIESKVRLRWERKWELEPGCRQSRYFIMKPSKKNTHVLLHESRDVVGQTVRFLTGHAFLKRHNAVVQCGFSPPPGDVRCRLCEEFFTEETPHHLITECEALCHWRAETFGSYILDEYPEWDMHTLLKFLRHQQLSLLESED